MRKGTTFVVPFGVEAESNELSSSMSQINYSFTGLVGFSNLTKYSELFYVLF